MAGGGRAGEEERKATAGAERGGLGGGGEGEEGAGIRVRVFELLEEAAVAVGAGEIGGRRRGHGDRAVALVAKVELRRRAASDTGTGSAAEVAARGRHAVF